MSCGTLYGVRTQDVGTVSGAEDTRELEPTVLAE